MADEAPDGLKKLSSATMVMEPTEKEKFENRLLNNDGKPATTEDECRLKRELLSKKQRLWLNTHPDVDESTRMARRVKHLTEMAKLGDCEREVRAAKSNEGIKKRRQEAKDMARNETHVRIEHEPGVEKRVGEQDTAAADAYSDAVERSKEEWRRYNATAKEMEEFVASLKVNETEVNTVDPKEYERIKKLAREDARRAEFVQEMAVPAWETAVGKWIEHGTNITGYYKPRLKKLKDELEAEEAKLRDMKIAEKAGEARLTEATHEAKRLGHLYNPHKMHRKRQHLDKLLAEEEMKLEKSLVGAALAHNNTKVRELRAHSIQRRLDLHNQLQYFREDMVEDKRNDINNAKNARTRSARELRVVREMLAEQEKVVHEHRERLARLTETANRDTKSSEAKRERAELNLVASRGYAKLLSASANARAAQGKSDVPIPKASDGGERAVPAQPREDKPLTVEDLRRQQYGKDVMPPEKEPEEAAPKVARAPLKHRLCETFGRAGAAEMLAEANIVC